MMLANKYKNYFIVYIILENNFYKFSFQFYCVIVIGKYLMCRIMLKEVKKMISMFQNRDKIVYIAITLCNEDSVVEQIKGGKVYSQQKLTLNYNYNGEDTIIILTVEEYINKYVEIYGYDKYFKFLSNLV